MPIDVAQEGPPDVGMADAPLAPRTLPGGFDAFVPGVWPVVPYPWVPGDGSSPRIPDASGHDSAADRPVADECVVFVGESQPVPRHTAIKISGMTSRCFDMHSSLV